MASSQEYLEYVLEQLAELEDIKYVSMMGEYLLYYQGKLIGGIYDDRLLVKPTPGALKLLPLSPLEQPYDGARSLLLVDAVDDRETLAELFRVLYEELPEPNLKQQEKRGRHPRRR